MAAQPHQSAGTSAARQVNPNIRKDKWTEAEDKALMRLVKTYGCAWAEISRLMDGRTDQQCMGRWRRHLDPAIRRDAWTAKEDASLQARAVSRPCSAATRTAVHATRTRPSAATPGLPTGTPRCGAASTSRSRVAAVCLAR